MTYMVRALLVDQHASAGTRNFVWAIPPGQMNPMREAFNDDLLESLLRANPRQSMRELAERLGRSHSAVENHFHILRKIQKYGK